MTECKNSRRVLVAVYVDPRYIPFDWLDRIWLLELRGTRL